MSWGIIVENSCVLCGASEESQGHIFFSCPYSAAVWAQILLKCFISRSPPSLQEEMLWGSTHRRGNSVECTIFKLPFSAATYRIWGERNNRIFKLKGVEWPVVLGNIVDNVCASLCSCNYVVKTWENVRLLQLCGVPSSVKPG